MSNETRKTLKDRAKEFTAQLPIMEGRNKGETKDILGQFLTITDYGFLNNEAGEPYGVFIVKGRDDKFYFAGSVLTARLLDLEAEGYHDDVVAEGLPVVMTEARGKKSNRNYINVEFYPEV